MSEAKSRASSLFAGFVVLLTLVTVAVAFLNQQLIIDHLKSWQYEPAAEMVTLRDKLDLTTEGELYFNASHPRLQSAAEFNQNCDQDRETNNPILGCYVTQQIFIFDIDNPKLNGIEETTAAHELLHAVYERMGQAEKDELGAELRAAYDRVKTPELVDRMKYYQKTEPGQELNELYAILGTEVADLGSVLERHYSNYFTDRTKIVAYHDAYNDVFTAATNQLKSLEQQINQSSSSINGRIAAYNDSIADLEADAEAFRARNNQGGFTNQADFDNAQAALLARQNDLDAERLSINAAIQRVKELQKQYNAVIKEYNQLSESINSSLIPIPSFE